MSLTAEKRHRPTALLLALTIAAAPFAAFAGPAEDKATARELAKEGIGAEQKGDCATAIDRLERAESLFHAPPHLQYLARCYTKVGRLVDATETWRKLTLEPMPVGSPQAFKEAVAEAKTELPKIEPRLGHLTIKTAQKYDGFAAEIDGKAWPAAALDVPRIIDPGKHVIRARATGYKTSEQAVDIGEGRSDTVTMTLVAGTDPGGTPSVASTSASTSAVAPTAVPTSPSTTDVTPSRPLRTVGFVTLSVGAAALAGGVITGLIATSKFDQLDKDCPDRRNCGVPDLAQRRNSVETLQTSTNIMLIGGGVLAAAGLTMVLLAPAAKGPGGGVALQFVPSFAGGHVSVTGSF